jgi:iron complex transport system substrate-binding protein
VRRFFDLQRMVAHVLLVGFLALAAVFIGAASARTEMPDLSGARRIVAVGGSVTEIIFALGAVDRLVARDSTSTYPEAARQLPDVGYMRALSPEGVLSVNPDAIIALEGAGPPEAVDVLTRAGVPMLIVPERFDRQGIVDKIMRIGTALGLESEAAELAGDVEADTRAAEAAARDGNAPNVVFILSLQGGKVLASGRGTAADGIIAMAGGRNVFDSFTGYKQVADEALISAQPEVIVMMDRGGDHGAGNDVLFAHPAIAPTPAGRHRRVVRMEGAYLLGFGPRTAGAVRDLSAALAVAVGEE